MTDPCSKHSDIEDLKRAVYGFDGNVGIVGEQKVLAKDVSHIKEKIDGVNKIIESIKVNTDVLLKFQSQSEVQVKERAHLYREKEKFEQEKDALRESLINKQEMIETKYKKLNNWIIGLAVTMFLSLLGLIVKLL